MKHPRVQVDLCDVLDALAIDINAGLAFKLNSVDMVSLALSLELSKLSQCFLPNCFDCVCRNLMQIGDALDKATMPGQTHLLQPQKL